MATVQLVAFNAASAVSADQQVGAGEVHTLIPVFDSGPGKVVVQAKLSNGKYVPVAFLSTRPANNKVCQAMATTHCKPMQPRGRCCSRTATGITT